MTRHWPPYEMMESELIDRAQSRLDKLERLYHVGQNNIWDGREVLDALIKKHGPPKIPAEKKESALKVLSILLWGELAAWAISADLAERIDDVEAKMAATSQAHDEARHFYVLRDYLRALGEPVPHLGGIGRRLLLSILETPSLVHKLIGMQLLTESNALAIFHGLVESKIEPVLAELLPYYEKDEARHVGLGVMYLPRLLSRLSAVETAGVVAFQLRSIAMLMSAGINMHDHFRNLGIDPRRMAEYTIKLQDDVTREMLADASHGNGAHRRDAVRGLLNPAQGYGPKILDFIHPRGGLRSRPAWHRTALTVWKRAAAAADRALA
ncbi:MAG TPA: ferritin-like domain-containing protein [Polyangia bacterium]|jgi:rubrerythrin